MLVFGCLYHARIWGGVFGFRPPTDKYVAVIKTTCRKTQVTQPCPMEAHYPPSKTDPSKLFPDCTFGLNSLLIKLYVAAEMPIKSKSIQIVFIPTGTLSTHEQ